MSEEKQEEGLFGIYLTTEMMKELDWNSVRIWDIIMGLWRCKDFEGVVSNERFARELGINERSVQRAVSKLVKLGYLRRVVIGLRRELLPGGRAVEGDKPVVVRGDKSVTHDKNVVLGVTNLSPRGDTNVTIKQEILKQEIFKEERETEAQLPARVVTLEPSKKKTRFDMKTSIAKEGYQELLSRTDLANGDRQWLYSQMESMQDWSINGHLKQDWLATARNWIKRARKSGDMPKGAAPARHQPKTFKQIDDEEFEKNLEEFRRMKL